jgi:hypothetical protein
LLLYRQRPLQGKDLSKMDDIHELADRLPQAFQAIPASSRCVRSVLDRLGDGPERATSTFQHA